MDRHGNLLIADAYNARILVVAHRTGRFYQQAMTAGDIYSVAGGGDEQRNGALATEAALAVPNDVLVDSLGNLVIDDTSYSVIRVVAEKTGTFYGQAMKAGHIYTVAGSNYGGYGGDGGPATAARIFSPEGIAFDSDGNLLIADTHNQRIRVVAASSGTFYGQPMTAGDIYTVAGDGTQGYSGDGGPATAAALSFPSGVAVDHSGNLVIADTSNQRVRVVAASSGTFYGQPMTAGDIYTVAGNGKPAFSGDGGAAASAALNYPSGVAVDAAGNLVIADTSNFRVRVVAASTGSYYGQAMTAGDIYPVAGKGNGVFSVDGGPATSAQFRPAGGLSADAAGDLAAADPDDQRVLLVAGGTGTFYGKAMTAGHLYTVAGDGRAGNSGDGGPATSARLNTPEGVALDTEGNLLIGDYANALVRVVARSTGTFYGQPMTAGDIYTIAGNGTSGFSGDGGPATSAELSNPDGVAVDGSGNVLIADLLNNRIRVVAAKTGTFYGQPMTAGDIYTIAGSNLHGFAGDGGPATMAKLWAPSAVAVDGSGNVLIADTDNSRIRLVAAKTGTFYGQPMTAGDIYTIAGDGITGGSGNGGPATAAELYYPEGVAVDGSGNVLIADSGNNWARMVAADSGTFYGQPATAGDIYAIAGDGTAGFSGNGGPAATAELNDPRGIAADSTGGALIADAGNARIREVSG